MLIKLTENQVACCLSSLHTISCSTLSKTIFSENNCFCCIQSVNQELQDALNEREQLKNQVQDYLLEVKRIEELLSSKVRR